MCVISIHSVSNPEAFWGGQSLRRALTAPHRRPSSEGLRRAGPEAPAYAGGYFFPSADERSSVWRETVLAWVSVNQTLPSGPAAMPCSWR